MNPSTPLRPRNVKPKPTSAIIVDAMNGTMPAYVDTGLNLVHVDDVAAGHWLAFERGRIGERYILGCETLPLRDILLTVAEITGGRAPLFRIPHALAMLIACVNESASRVVGRGTPRVSIDSVRMSKQKMFFTCEKARYPLEFAPRPAMEALRDAINWHQLHNTNQ